MVHAVESPSVGHPAPRFSLPSLTGAAVIQVAPNLLESARRYFASEILPFPFVCDPNMRRLHHHAMTAQEQGIFLVDKEGVIRHLTIVGPIDPVPGGVELAELARTHCAGTPVPA